MATDIIMAERPTFGDHKSRGCLFCSINPFPPPIQTNKTFLPIQWPIIEFIRVKKYYGMPKGA